MTDNLLQKLEEKLMSLLHELDSLRKEVQVIKHENASLKAEHASYSNKLQGLVSFLDTLDSTHSPTTNQLPLASKHEVAVVREEEFATA